MKQTEIISAAKKEAQEIIEKTRENVAKEADIVREELIQQASEIADIIVKKLLPG